MTTLAALGLSLALALISTALFLALFGDWACFRHGHLPRKHPLGGFRCARCGIPADDLDGLGQVGGYVRPGERPQAHREGPAMREVAR
jgi:hypothetical protein